MARRARPSAAFSAHRPRCKTHMKVIAYLALAIPTWSLSRPLLKDMDLTPSLEKAPKVEIKTSIGDYGHGEAFMAVSMKNGTPSYQLGKFEMSSTWRAKPKNWKQIEKGMTFKVSFSPRFIKGKADANDFSTTFAVTSITDYGVVFERNAKCLEALKKNKLGEGYEKKNMYSDSAGEEEKVGGKDGLYLFGRCKYHVGWDSLVRIEWMERKAFEHPPSRPFDPKGYPRLWAEGFKEDGIYEAYGIQADYGGKRDTAALRPTQELPRKVDPDYLAQVNPEQGERFEIFEY